MIRKTVTILLTLAAILTGAVWAMSYSYERATRVFRFELTDESVIRVYLQEGAFLIQCFHDVPSTRIWSRGPVFGTLECRVGAADRRHHRGSYGQFLRVGSPFWLPFVLFAAYPAIAFISGPLRRWRRRRKGLCTGCGYNLTGNTSGICPECGAEIDRL